MPEKMNSFLLTFCTFWYFYRCFDWFCLTICASCVKIFSICFRKRLQIRQLLQMCVREDENIRYLRKQYNDDARVKRSKSRSCLHDKAFELGTRQTWESSDLRSKSADFECLQNCGSCFAAEQFVGISWRQQKTQLPTVLRSTVRKLCHNRTDQPAECRSVRGPESLDAATSSELNSSRRYKTCILIACRDNIPQIIWHLIYP